MSASDQPDRVRLERYIGRMERGEFWLAHEELEALWMERRDDALKGLIHLAAALVHAQRGNRGGVSAKASSCLRLVGDRDEVMGLRLDPVRAMAERLLEVARGDSPPQESVEAVGMARWYEGEVDPDVLEEVELPYRVRRYDDGYRIGRDPHRRDD